MWQTRKYLILQSAFCAQFLQMVLNKAQVLFVLLFTCINVCVWKRERMVLTHDLFLVSGKLSYPLMEEDEWILSSLT